MIKANSQGDIYRLAGAVASTPPDEHWKVVAAVLSLGLMKPRGALRFVVWVVRRFRGASGVRLFCAALARRSPDVIKSMMADTLIHIVHGVDTEDDDSVGGWSQREIDVFLNKVSFSSLAKLPGAA